MNVLSPQLRLHGLVAQPLTLTWQKLRELPADHRVSNVGELVEGRTGEAVRIDALLRLAGVDPTATHLGLHATRDDFHASVPLDTVSPRGLLVYAQNDQPLTESQGGPFRLLIVDYASCQSDEIDECANVKYLDAIELTCGKGYDNRPQDEDEHAKLHAKETPE